MLGQNAILGGRYQVDPLGCAALCVRSNGWLALCQHDDVLLGLPSDQQSFIDNSCYLIRNSRFQFVRLARQIVYKLNWAVWL